MESVLVVIVAVLSLITALIAGQSLLAHYRRWRALRRTEEHAWTRTVQRLRTS